MTRTENSTNEEIVRRMTDAINQRDLAALDDIVASGLLRHSGATPHLKIESLEQFKDFLRQDFAAVPDSRQEIDLIFSSGNFVAARVLYRGTQKGPWGTFPPSNRRLELPFIGILRVEDGRVAEIWVEWDNLNALQQLGHYAPPGSA